MASLFDSLRRAVPFGLLLGTVLALQSCGQRPERKTPSSTGSGAPPPSAAPDDVPHPAPPADAPVPRDARIAPQAVPADERPATAAEPGAAMSAVPEDPSLDAAVPLRPYTPEAGKNEPQRVRVYYGTNREALIPVTSPVWMRVVAISGLLLLALIFVQVVGSLRRWSYPALTRIGVATLLVACMTGWAWNPFPGYSRTIEQSRGVVYGPRADAQGLVHYGHCDVTLPPPGKREVGALPMSRPGWEDPDKHVILDRTELLLEEAFFAELKTKLTAMQPGGRDVFVFVHGYNVDFRSAACRTAQLCLDLEFKGIPLFFSWPSQGALIGYTADVDEVQDSIVPIKEFLVRVAEDLNAEKVHVLAHSKGGAAVSFAIGQIDPDRKLFNQVILAAPDINANTFRRDIAPRLSKLALRSTLYCSQTDRALRGSMLFNSYKRAGDANEPIVIEPQLDTVDATGLDPSYLGHSYYGDCKPLIEDVRKLFGQNSEPRTRGLLEQRIGEKVYWMFKLGN